MPSRSRSRQKHNRSRPKLEQKDSRSKCSHSRGNGSNPKCTGSHCKYNLRRVVLIMAVPPMYSAKLITNFLLFFHFNSNHSDLNSTNPNNNTVPSPSSIVSWKEFSSGITSNGFPAPSHEQFDSFDRQLPTGLISEKLEAAMFLAQIIHESGGLQYKRELACIQTGCPGVYDNSVGVPGQNYYGRGYIQLTHSYNYKAASLALYGDLRLIKDADMVARDEDVAWGTAFWFWKAHVHSRPGVQKRQFGDATKAINGIECPDMETARKRFQYYQKVVTAFGISETPNEHGCYD